MKKIASIELRHGIILDMHEDGRWTSDDPVVARLANQYMENPPLRYRPYYYYNLTQEIAEDLHGTILLAPETPPAPTFDDDGEFILY